MAQIISIVNQKGGVGKTTTSINLGAALAQLGKFVLLVDIDPQANATSGIGVNWRELKTGVYQTIMGNASLRDVIMPTGREHLSLAPATMDLAGSNVELVNMPNREMRLREALLEVRHDYDYILIDCPPSLGLLTLNGLVAADKILIPVQAEYYALEGLGQLISTIDLVRENLRPDLLIGGAILTMFDSRNKLSGEVMQELYKYFPQKIFRSVIPRTVKLAEAPSFGKTIFEYEPSGKGASAYERLAWEVVEVLEAGEVGIAVAS
ncbi:MAG: ParA family protein [Patescibacteria group bacterium]